MHTDRVQTGARLWPGSGGGRVLVVLDRPVLVDLIALTLNHTTCTVRTAFTAAEVKSIATEWQPHLLILDMAIDSSAIMQQIRTRAIPGLAPRVIGLVVRADLRSKLAAFDAGVDDILGVPFAPEELLARVIALMRRSGTDSDSISFSPTISVGVLEIDILNHSVRAGDTQLHLTALELGLLYLLASNPGHVLTRGEIRETLWGMAPGVDTRRVDPHIRKLRTRLEVDAGQPRFIATVPGRGYRFLPSGQTD